MIQNVTLIRLISTYILVAYHAQFLVTGMGANSAGVDSMRAGTDLFIVCSAFLTAHVNTRRSITGMEFLRRRVVRIVPLYWVMTLSVFALVFFFPFLFNSTKPSIDNLVKSLLFIPYRKGSELVQPIIFVAWTLNLIMGFSLIFAVSIASSGLKHAWITATAIILALIGIGQIFPSHSVAIGFYTDTLLIEFLFGLLLTKFTGRLLDPERLIRSKSIDLAACTTLAVLALAAILLKPYFWPDTDRALAFGLPCLLIFAVAIRLEGRGYVVRWHGLKTLSTFAFSIYLSHFFCTGTAGIVFDRYVPQTAPIAFGLLLVTLASATLLGAVLHYLVEKPLVAVVEAMTKRSPGLIQGPAPVPADLDTVPGRTFIHRTADIRSR